MDDTGFLQKKISHKVYLLKGSIIVWSKCADTNFYMTFSVYIYAPKSVAPPLLVLPEKRLNKNFIEFCDIKGANLTTTPKGFINST